MSHDESYQAMLLRKQREARKEYGVSQEMGDETEAQVDAVYFTAHSVADNGTAECRIQHSDYGESWHEDEQQAKFLREEGKWQERTEKAFCCGMMVGGVTALTVLVATLWILGVL